MVRVAAGEDDLRDGLVRSCEAFAGGIDAEFDEVLTGGEAEDRADSLVKLIEGSPAISARNGRRRGSNLEALTEFAWLVRQELRKRCVTGAAGVEVDHIEVFGPAADPALADSWNFVLCPEKAYDRSPYGPGEVWRQAGILGTVFECRIEAPPGGKILPHVSGRAWVNGESTCIFNPDDPFCHGIRTT